MHDLRSRLGARRNLPTFGLDLVPWLHCENSHSRSSTDLTRLLSLAENPSAKQDHGYIEYAKCEKVVLPWEEWSPSALEDHDPQCINSVGDGIHNAYPPKPLRDVSQRKQRAAQKEKWQVHESLDYAEAFEALHT